VELRVGGVFQLAIAPPGDVVTVGADNLIQTIAIKHGQICRIELPVKGVYGLAFFPMAVTRRTPPPTGRSGFGTADDGAGTVAVQTQAGPAHT
jgi:hypothetical protein